MAKNFLFLKSMICYPDLCDKERRVIIIRRSSQILNFVCGIGTYCRDLRLLIV